MTQKSPAAIREAFITNIQANATIMALLSDANEVRELNWKGTTFSYPNIRVRINSPLSNFQDCYQELNISIYFFSEQSSSYEADNAVGVISNEYHNKSTTIGGMYCSRLQATVVPAIPVSDILWRSEVTITSPLQ